MSHLYFVGRSDSRKHAFTSRGHQGMFFNVYYGSRDNSEKALTVIVSWPKGAEKPFIVVKNYVEVT